MKYLVLTIFILISTISCCNQEILPNILNSNNQKKEYVFRFDTRSPRLIKDNGGFNAWGTNMDLISHVSGESVENRTSAYISTSQTPEHCLSFSRARKEGYIYKIIKSENAVDVNASVGEKYKYYLHEREIAFKDKIPNEHIISYVETRKEGLKKYFLGRPNIGQEKHYHTEDVLPNPFVQPTKPRSKVIQVAYTKRLSKSINPFE